MPEIADPAVARRIAAEQAVAEQKRAAQAQAAQEQAQQAQKCEGVMLVIESWSWGQESDYLRATGEVTNLTQEPLENVAPSVSYYTADDTFVKNDEAVIDYNPVLPGQTSPFSTITTGNPLVQSARIQIKELFGGTINAMEREEYDATCS